MPHKHEKLSLQARIDASLLAFFGTKKMSSHKETYDLSLELHRRRNAKPYHIPKIVTFENSVAHHTRDGMKVYRINSRHSASEKHILYLHGGSYVAQPEIFHWPFLDKIATATNASILVPIYPKAPDHKFPEAFDKVLRVYKRMLIKTKAENIVLMGDSAGGGFALALAQVIADRGLPEPGNIILISPWMDVSESNPEITKYEDCDKMISVYGLIRSGRCWAGDDVKNPMVSPVYGRVEGLGKVTMFLGTHEVVLPDCRVFRDRMAKAGIEMNYFECAGLGHVFPLYPGLPEAAWAIDIMAKVIKGEPLK